MNIVIACKNPKTLVCLDAPLPKQFISIEALLNKWANSDQAKWVYGNVYDPETGDPLNWWQALLQV